MPRADYVPFTTTKPEELRRADERVQINVPDVQFPNSIGRALASVGEQGFGTLSKSTHAIGEAFDKLGTTLEGVGNQLWQRAEGLQEVQNQTTLTKAEIEYDKYAQGKQIEFNKLQGEAATEGSFKAHLKDLEDKQKEMLGKLPNQSVAQRFDKSTTGTIGRYGMQAAEHAATETRKAFIASSEARVDQYKDQITEAKDPEVVKDLASKIHDEIYGKQAPAKGWGLDVAAQALKKQVGDAYVSMASRLSREDPTTARKILEANEKYIDKDKYNAAMEHIGNNERRIQSNNIGNKVQEANPDATLPEKKEEAKKQAEALGSKDPLLIQAAVDDVEQKHDKHRKEVTQQLQLDNETVWNTMYGHTSPHGEVPTTPYELFAYGGEEVRKAYDRLGQKDQNKVNEILKKNAKGDVPETEATRTRVHDLEGMWIQQPGMFRDWDIEHENIPLADRSRLRQKQLQVIKEGIKLENDPQTSGALSKMRSGGILPKDLTPSSPRWNTFTGMVREAILEEGKKKGFDKPLTEQEIISIGKTLLDKMPGSGHWPFDWGQSQVYQSFDTVPEPTKEYMRGLYPGIGDEEMLQKYRQTKIREEYNKRYQQGGQPVRK